MNRPAQSDRERVYRHLNYFGLRTVANIVRAIGLDEHVVRKCLVELATAGYVKPITEADGTVYVEVVPGKRYDDANIEFQLAKDREREAAQAASAEREQPPPATTPHASLPAGPHMPAARRRRRAHSPTSQAAGRKAAKCSSRRYREIMQAFRELGPKTRDELCQARPMIPSGTIDGRCNELVDEGYLIIVGERPTRHGTPAGVLALNPAKLYPF